MQNFASSSNVAPQFLQVGTAATGGTASVLITASSGFTIVPQVVQNFVPYSRDLPHLLQVSVADAVCVEGTSGEVG